jgi:hypothetical protein
MPLVDEYAEVIANLPGPSFSSAPPWPETAEDFRIYSFGGRLWLKDSIIIKILARAICTPWAM